MMLDSIDNGPLVYPTVEENRQTRPNKYSELTEAQQLQDECDVQAANIILHGLLPDVYALVNHQEAAKDIWDKVKLLMKGTQLSYQELNDIHTIGMIMQQVQVNTKFLNALLPEWSKFVTDVKLANSLYTTKYNQLYAYLSQHERHDNEVRIMHERYPDPLALVANSQTLYNPSQSPQHSDSGLAVPIFHQGEDPIDCINKEMEFLSAISSRFPPSNNQLRIFAGTRNKGIATNLRGNYEAGQEKIVKCYNCLGEGHMAKQCTQPKRSRSYAWFKEKLMLDEAQEAGQILDEEQLAFIEDPRIAEVQVTQQTIPQNLAFQTEDLEVYDLDYDDIYSAKVVLMVNLSSCDSDVLFEVPYYDTYLNDMINQDV
ncbi:retrovirus-related pol polyprotein from transposon TNT 1-94 [Tanacetum coccineum]